ncbi:MAG: LCP family protein [Chloroflexota bacterium]|nr:LCP family protein [Chloroflexota bacterium]
MSSNRSPFRAAALSFVFPGLGQIYVGAVARGVAWALPSVLLVLGALVLLAGGPTGLFGLVTQAETLLALVVLWLAVGFYHLAAMLDAYGLAQRDSITRARLDGPGVVGVALLIALTLVMHGVPGAAGLWLYDYETRNFPGQGGIVPPTPNFEPEPTPTPGPTPTPSPTPSPSPTPTEARTPRPGSSPTASATAAASPSPTPRGTFAPMNAPWADNGRLDILLIGTDAGPGRRGGRTDTMILLSVEIVTGKAALFGFPRNMYNVPVPRDANGQDVEIFIDPFYQGGSAGLLTNLWQRAYEEPQNYYTPEAACPTNVANREQCLAEARAWRATTGAIQYMAGVPIDGVVAINLSAFRELVDAVGGVWIDVPQRIYDDKYPTEDGVSPRVIDIPKGCHKLNGVMALAFARSRHQDSDYQRMRRQQIVLQAVRRQLDPLAMLGEAPRLLNIAADNLYMTFAHHELGTLAEAARRVDPDRMYQVRFAPSRYPSELSDTVIRSIRRRVQNIFTEPEPTPSPREQRNRCPTPGQTPGPLSSYPPGGYQ